MRQLHNPDALVTNVFDSMCSLMDTMWKLSYSLREFILGGIEFCMLEARRLKAMHDTLEVAHVILEACFVD